MENFFNCLVFSVCQIIMEHGILLYIWSPVLGRERTTACLFYFFLTVFLCYQELLIIEPILACEVKDVIRINLSLGSRFVTLIWTGGHFPLMLGKQKYIQLVQIPAWKIMGWEGQTKVWQQIEITETVSVWKEQLSVIKSPVTNGRLHARSLEI